MSSKVFKQELWSKQIQNDLNTLTGLRTHSDYAFDGEIKQGNVLHITGSAKPTVGTYVPGTDINFERVSGTDMTLVIDKYKYATQTFDDVDRAQSIPGVMENATREMAKALHEEADKDVAKAIKDATENGVKYTGKDDQEATETVAQEESASAFTKANAQSRIEDGLVALAERNVAPSTNVWGEFSPKAYSCIRQSLTETLTNNVDLAKTGAVGKYNNVSVCIENNLPVDGTGKIRYNVLRTDKAIAFAGQVDKVEAGRIEKQFADYVKALYVYGIRVVRPKEMYILKESIA
jgi:hypothetical protein